MRRTKRMENNGIEVMHKNGKFHPVQPDHEWYHIFVRMAQLEDKEDTKEIIVPDDDMDPYRCPSCGNDLGFTDDYFGDLTDIRKNGRYCQKCGQKLC